jgi:RNA polymerase sigma-70 factor (ECF subfamily)
MTNALSAQNKPITPTKTRTETAEWETLYRAQMPRIYNFLRYRLRDEIAAEDLTATTFEKAWRHRRSYNPGEAAFTTWLFTIARNAAIDYLRTQKEELPLKETAPSHAPSPEETASKRQELTALQQIVAGLPDREQEILALKYGAELSTRQIAKQTGLSTVNVRIILFRTLRKLRPQLQIGPILED